MTHVITVPLVYPKVGPEFPRESLEQAARDFTGVVPCGRYGDQLLNNATHVLHAIRFEGDRLVADIVVLETKGGKDLLSLMEKEAVEFGATGIVHRDPPVWVGFRQVGWSVRSPEP